MYPGVKWLVANVYIGEGTLGNVTLTAHYSSAAGDALPR